MTNKSTGIMALPEASMTSFRILSVTENHDLGILGPLVKAPHVSPCVGK